MNKMRFHLNTNFIPPTKGGVDVSFLSLSEAEKARKFHSVQLFQAHEYPIRPKYMDNGRKMFFKGLLILYGQELD